MCRAADRPARIHSRDELHTCVSASVILRCYLRQPPPPITTHTPAACLWGSGWVLKRISCCEWTILVRDVIRNRCQVGSTWFPWQQQNPQMRRALLFLPVCLSLLCRSKLGTETQHGGRKLNNMTWILRGSTTFQY